MGRGEASQVGVSQPLRGCAATPHIIHRSAEGARTRGEAPLISVRRCTPKACCEVAWRPRPKGGDRPPKATSLVPFSSAQRPKVRGKASHRRCVACFASLLCKRSLQSKLRSRSERCARRALRTLVRLAKRSFALACGLRPPRRRRGCRRQHASLAKLFHNFAGRVSPNEATEWAQVGSAGREAPV